MLINVQIIFIREELNKKRRKKLKFSLQLPKSSKMVRMGGNSYQVPFQVGVGKMKSAGRAGAAGADLRLGQNGTVRLVRLSAPAQPAPPNA